MNKVAATSSGIDAHQKLLIEIADAHYTMGKSQKQIAKERGVHASTVSRWIQDAHDLGIVHISLCPPTNETLRSSLLENLYRQGVDEILVCSKGRSQVAQATARYFESIAVSGSTVVLDGGKTVEIIVDSLRQNLFQKMTIIPIAGDPPSYDVSAYELSSRMARKYPIESTCKKPPVWKEPNLDPMHNAVCDAARNANFILLGAGPWKKDYTALEFVQHLGVTTKDAERDNSKAAAVVGYLVLDKNGAWLNPAMIDSKMRRCIEYKRIQELASKPETCRSIVIAHGADKAESVFIAIKARLINMLVIDEPLAIELGKLLAE